MSKLTIFVKNTKLVLFCDMHKHQQIRKIKEVREFCNVKQYKIIIVKNYKNILLQKFEYLRAFVHLEMFSSIFNQICRPLSVINFPEHRVHTKREQHI